MVKVGVDMEEDLKVLEEYIKEQKEFAKQFNLEEIEDGTEGQRRLRAIENLIKGYKELEEELEQRIEQKVLDYRYVDKEMIPKSKVREKIEEIDKILDRNLLVDSLRDYFTAKKEVLQELLQEGENNEIHNK